MSSGYEHIGGSLKIKGLEKKYEGWKGTRRTLAHEYAHIYAGVYVLVCLCIPGHVF